MISSPGKLFLAGLIVFSLLYIQDIYGQQDYAHNKKKPRKSQVKPSRSSSNKKDTTEERQKLFTLLQQLNQAKGVFFLFSDQSLGNVLVTPVSFTNKTTDQILGELLAQTGLRSKKINANTLVILPAKDNLPRNADDRLNTGSRAADNAAFTLKGRVFTEGNEPLESVSITVKGTGKGVVTNADGSFSIKAAKGDVLEISRLGFAGREIRVSAESNNSLLIRLALDDRQMNEVVVTALGIGREQKALGYSIATVSSEDITASGNTNFAAALYGKIAGGRITTAPGGATSAVQVQVRGLNSLNFNTQPLYVVDGVVIRNINEKGALGLNNAGYWDDQRIRGNGILDINPADIENLTVLKGAGATALYGSEAASGVVIITTKKGLNRPGLGVEINYTTNMEQVAFLPKYQNIYGPGYDRATNLAEGASEDGWIYFDKDGDGINESIRPNFKSYSQFGPKMDGRLVSWWDGQVRPYSPQPDNHKDFYRNGFSSIFNASFANQSDRASYRFSYTRNDYKGIQVGGNMNRNNFNLNSSFKISDRISTDVVVNYVNSKVHNRPFQLNRIIASYSGLINRAEDMSVIFNKYQTGAGYKYIPWDQPQRNPAEALHYIMKDEILNFLWMQLRNSEDEYQDRLLSSVTLNYQIAKGLKFRGRIGNDFTSLNIETKQHNEYPTSFNVGNSTGAYITANGRYSIIYGDALLTYSKKITPKLSLDVNAGYQARNEEYSDNSSTTTGGLIKENWFSLNNSYGFVETVVDRSALLKYAFLGFMNLSYKNFIFLEATARNEYSSTLPPGNNSYFYPSVNTSFVFSEIFRMPSFIDFGKLRASYGVVGNAPPPYASGVLYTRSTLSTLNGPVASLSSQAAAGNNYIRPENKYETELGLELILFKKKLDLDITWYSNRTVDQILPLTVPSSTGAISKLVNAGELQSDGLELSVTAIPVSIKNLTWNTRMNFAIGRTKVKRLADGVSRITYYTAEEGAINIVAEEGETVGNIYVFPHLADDRGNYIIGDNGLYVMDKTRYEKAGNVMPRITGGLSNTIRYKNFSLDFMIDYRFGGKLVSPALKYNIGAGMYESTLQYRDEANGGLPYYINNSGVKILLSGHNDAAPDGSTVYHDGLILKGVTVAGKENTTIVDAPYYYYNMFAWGASALNKEGAVFDNDYIKMREAVLSYNLPAKLAGKWHFNSVRFSLIGRNLFYFLKTLDNMDPEAPIGTSWIRQSVDDGSMAATRSYGFSLHLGF